MPATSDTAKPKAQAPRSTYDRKARAALIALGAFVESLPASIMLSNVCPKRDALLEAVEDLKPKGWKG